jgi:hypothetical protein
MITMAVRYRRNKLNTFFLCLIGVGLMQTIGLNKRMIMEAITQDDDPWSSFYAPVVAESCLPTFLQPFTSTLRRSDFVELDHCPLHSLNWTKFRSWADSIVESNLSKLTIAKVNNASLQVSDLKEEWTMELLEMYATHSGLCRFEDYHPRIPRKASIQGAGLKLQTVVKNTPVPPKQTRIVFSIVAYKDSTHLRRLIEAIHLPHHLIIIHLEQMQSDDTYISQVEAIAADYSNVAVVQFGTIIYKTDSISRVTLQLMSWVVKELKLEFDYFAALGGAVYPLFGALELSQHLYASQENVWLGEATLKGGRVQTSQSHLLWKHRLLTTSTKIAVRAGALFQDTVPEWMDRALQHKSNSGNQAMFSFSTIERMLNSSKVLHIFALAKYSCCCCVEGKSHCLVAEKYFRLVACTKYYYVFTRSERTWIAAMHAIGLLEEARKNTNMFQLWGGADNRCTGSMSNAILDLNETRCFRNESPNQEDAMYFWGNSTWDRVTHAKRQGIMFARKFSSSHHGSVQLLEKIQSELHVPSRTSESD